MNPNPFVSIRTSVSAGFFAASGTQKQGVTMAERICAALSSVIAEDKAKVFQPESWSQSVGNIPYQINSLEAEINKTISENTAPSELAKLCISPKFLKTSTADLTSGLETLIENLPKLQSLESLNLNCISISLSKSGDLQISLAILAIDGTDSDLPSSGTRSVKGTLSETIAGYKDHMKDFDEIFGDFEALKATPYYVCVPGNS